MSRRVLSHSRSFVEVSCLLAYYRVLKPRLDIERIYAQDVKCLDTAFASLTNVNAVRSNSSFLMLQSI